MSPDEKENLKQIKRDAKELRIGMESAKLAGAEPVSINFALMLLKQAEIYAVDSIKFKGRAYERARKNQKNSG